MQVFVGIKKPVYETYVLHTGIINEQHIIANELPIIPFISSCRYEMVKTIPELF